jgi:hypothetical protein
MISRTNSRLVVSTFVAISTASFLFGVKSAEAVLLGPGDQLPLPGTTSAAEPHLAAVVIEDESIPFSFPAAGGGDIVGSVQQRVSRSEVDGTLDFYWRVFNDANSAAPIGSFRVGDFVSPEYNANWRIDGLGDKGPDAAHRFDVPQESFVNFLFESSTPGAAPGLLPGQSSTYFFLDTTATLYAKTALYDLTGTGAGAISGLFEAFTPTTVPEPTSAVLMIAGATFIAAAASNRRRC